MTCTAADCSEGMPRAELSPALFSSQGRSERYAGLSVLIVLLLLFVGLSAVTLPTAYAASEDSRDGHVPGMALPGEKCRIVSSQMPAHWTEAEKWAWNELCEGRSADFNRRLNDVLDPRNPDHVDRWVDGRRTLSPEFLRTILLFEPFRSATPFSGISILGTHIPGDIVLNEAVSTRPFEIRGSFVRGSVFMVRFSTSSIVSFRVTAQV